MSNGKPRIVGLYRQLSSLNGKDYESITDYIIQTESIASSLREAGEIVSDGLLIAMVLKGLPSNFKPFQTVITQRDKSMMFTEFKVSFLIPTVVGHVTLFMTNITNNI